MLSLGSDTSKKSPKVSFLFDPRVAGVSRGGGRTFGQEWLWLWLWRWDWRGVRGIRETLTGAPSCDGATELSDDCMSISSSWHKGKVGPAVNVNIGVDATFTS